MGVTLEPRAIPFPTELNRLKRLSKVSLCVETKTVNGEELDNMTPITLSESRMSTALSSGMICTPDSGILFLYQFDYRFNPRQAMF